MPSLCVVGRFRNTAEQHPLAYGAVGSDGGSQIRLPPNWPWASRARGSRDPGRRRRSRPTLTTPRESVPGGRDGRDIGQYRLSRTIFWIADIFRTAEKLFSPPPSRRDQS